MEKSRFVPGTYVYVGLAAGVGVSAIIGWTVFPTLVRSYYGVDHMVQSGARADGLVLGAAFGGLAGLILAAIGWMIGVISGKGHTEGCSVWLWAVINAVICGAFTALGSWVLANLISLGFMGGH